VCGARRESWIRLAALHARGIHSHADQVTEERCQLLPVGVGQRRLEKGLNVCTQVPSVAGPEQHHVDARLVAGEPVGCLRDVAGTALVDQEGERLGCLAQPSLDLPLAAAWRTATATRSGFAKMLLTANMRSVPIRLSRVSGKIVLRAL
jgi:hypothetical protein